MAVIGVVIVRVSGAATRREAQGTVKKQTFAGRFPVYAPVVTSKDGWVCVNTNFDTYDQFGLDSSYRVKIEKYVSGRGYEFVRQSKKMSANDNLDHVCFADKINKNIGYRAKFVIDGGAETVAGDWWIWGYKRN